MEGGISSSRSGVWGSGSSVVVTFPGLVILFHSAFSISSGSSWPGGGCFVPVPVGPVGGGSCRSDSGGGCFVPVPEGPVGIFGATFVSADLCVRSTGGSSSPHTRSSSSDDPYDEEKDN